MIELTNVTLLYLVTGNSTHYLLLIKILNMSNTTALVNMTVISHNILLSYILSYPLFLLFIPNMSSNNVTTYEGINVNVINTHNFTIYIDTYNNLVIHYVGNGKNVTLIGASIPLAPNVYRPIHLFQEENNKQIMLETLLFTIALTTSFYYIFERVSKK